MKKLNLKLNLFESSALLLLIAILTAHAGSQGAIANTNQVVETDQDNSDVPAKRGERRLRVGLRNDVKPFSYPHEYLESVDLLPNYKGFMVEVCRQVIRRMKMTEEYSDLIVQAVPVNASTRFEDLEYGRVDMLCGPDSLTTDRVETHNVSHPVFLSGMTYGYLRPTSHRFPRAEHCGNVVGFVNNTTAESTGIEQLIRNELLMRFHNAAAYNLELDARRFEMLNTWVEAKKKNLEERHTLVTDALGDVLDQIKKDDERSQAYEIFAAEDPETEEYLRCTFNTDNRDRYVRDKAEGYRNDPGVNYRLQKIISREIITPECPNGFTEGMPVKKYPSHNKGVEAFCKGDVLYYLGDYDILRSKVTEQTNCDVELNRFTSNTEVYGAFFRSKDILTQEAHPTEGCPSPEPFETDFSTKEQSTTLYADYNRTLLRMMQADTDILGHVYRSEFEGEPMSADLEAFFNGFRVAADLNLPQQ